jgi:gliding motility-associated-like protein
MFVANSEAMKFLDYRFGPLLLRFWIVSLLLLGGIGPVFAQTCPGGTTGMPVALLVHWVRPEGSSCLTNGCNIATITANVGTVANSVRPAGTATYRDNPLNYNPAVRLTDGKLTFARATPSVNTNIAAFGVFKKATTPANTNPGNWWDAMAVLSADGGSGADFGIVLDDGDLRYAHTQGDAYCTATPATVTANVSTLYCVQRYNAGNGSDDAFVFLMGSATNTAGNSHNGDINNFTNFCVGRAAGNHNDSRIDGDFGEIIIFAETLTVAQQRRVESYLAIKYGLTISQNYMGPDGVATLYDRTGYTNDIFGIGRFDGELLHQRLSQSANSATSLKMHAGTYPILGCPTINASGAQDIAGNNQFLVVGHDNLAVTFTRSVGTGTNNMMARTYKATETGALGTVTLYFDNAYFTALGAGPYYFAHSTTPGVGLGATLVPMIPDPNSSGDYYVEVDFPSGTNYFTITNTSDLKGPAGINTGLQAWYMGERKTGTTQAVTTWSDLSGSSRDLVNTAGTVLKLPTVEVSWQRYITGVNLNDQFSTGLNLFTGRTIVGVFQGINGGTGDGMAGFGTLTEAGYVSNATNQVRATGSANDWTNSPGTLRQDGVLAPAATAPASDWMLLLGARPSATAIPSPFQVGGFGAASAYDSVKVAEIAVYSTALTTPEVDRMESYFAIKYGITLGHPYYASNWNGATGRRVYFAGAYSNEIIGIAQDLQAGLRKAQSKSSSKNDIFSLSLGPTKANDSLNNAAFPADMDYLMAGHDGLGVNCWSTNKINTPTEPNDHVRVERTWKMFQTGPSWTGSPEIDFQFDVDNASMNVAALPPGATTYYLYVCTDSMFSAGVAMYPMTFATGRWTVALDSVEVPNGRSFFTIGTKLNKASYEDPIVCYGDTIINYGSNLADATGCTMMSFEDGGGFQYRTIQSTGIAPHLFDVDDEVGGCVDTLYWVVPINIPAGTYSVLIDPLGIGCDSALYGPAVNAGKGLLNTLTVTASDVAALTWGTPGDTIFCVGESNVLALKGGGCSTGSLSLIASDNPAITLISQLVASNTFATANFGEILVHAGDTGTHHIRFVTNTLSPCKDSIDYIFHVKPSTTTTISYTGSPYCGGLLTPQTPTVLNQVPGSTFTSNPASGGLNTATGELTIPIFPTGTYIISYVPPLGQCASPSSTTISVDPAIRANFSYLDTHYCEGAGIIGPWITNRPATGSFQIAAGSPGSAAAIDIDTTSGFIDLDSTAPGTYYIEYNVRITGCFYNAQDTIFVHALPDASFTVGPNDTMCPSGGGVTCVPTNPGGIFTTPGGFLTLVGIDSVIPNPAFVGGPFPIRYRIDSTYCSDSTTELVWVRGQQLADIEYGTAAYCQNEPNPLPFFLSGTAGGKFLSNLGGMNILPLTGEIDLAGSTPGSYVVLYKVPDLTCPDTIPVDTITILAVPSAAFTLTPDSVCQGSGILPINTVPPSGNAFTIWSGNQQVVNGIVNNDTVDADVLPPGGPYEIRNIRTTGICADTAYDYLVVNRRDSANIEFDPPIVCLGGFNPYPVILGDGGGIFSSLIPGDSVHPDSGIVYIGIDTVTYWVLYVTQGNCPSRDSDSVQVRAVIDPTFSYNQADFCSSDSGIVIPDYIASPPPAGYFSGDSGLVINSASGLIDLVASTSGPHNVLYTIDQTGACANDYVVTITITDPDVGTFISLPQDSFCWRGNEIVQVAITGTTGGIFSAEPGLVFSNSDSGTVSLSGSVPNLTNPYTIYYNLPTVCEEDIDSVDIWIFPRDNPAFNYSATGFCNGSPNELPTVATPGGTFEVLFPTDTVVQVNTVTGELQLEDNFNEGTAQIEYVTSGGCPDSLTIFINISDQPTSIKLLANPDSVICEGQPVRINTVGGDFWYFYLGNNPVPLDSTNFHLFDSLQNNDTVRVRFYTDAGCTVEEQITIEVQEIPSQAILPYPEIISSDQPFIVQMLATSTDSTYFEWFIVNDLGGITFPQTHGYSADTVDSAGIAPIPINLTLENGFTPAQFMLLVQPWAKECHGGLDTIQIKVNPNALAIFIPQVMTPDGNDQNDTWLIQWKDEIIPSEFTINLYNEAGAKVHSMSPLESTWDGGNLPDGVYWYMLLDAAGEMVEAGGLTIRRR